MVLAASAAAQSTGGQPVVLPTPGGRVVSPNEQLHNTLHEEWHFAPARVEGDLVFISGIVGGARDGKAVDVAGLEAVFRRAWTAVKTTLEAAGAGTDTIVDLTTYHVFGSPLFTGTKRDHIDAFRRVKDEFVPAPYPAWTGIGVAALFPDTGLVEIKAVARLRAAGAAK
jgi:enamine deaminase RidA (YjgF/YER057c/UK114 family)